MPRGGRRPGAGAPKGNLNALRSGRYSRRVQGLRVMLAALLTVPEFREYVIAVWSRNIVGSERTRRARIAFLRRGLDALVEENNRRFGRVPSSKRRKNAKNKDNQSARDAADGSPTTGDPSQEDAA